MSKSTKQRAKFFIQLSSDELKPMFLKGEDGTLKLFKKDMEDWSPENKWTKPFIPKLTDVLGRC